MQGRSAIAPLAATLALAACGGGSDVGDLQAIIDEGGETNGFADFSKGVDKSFGVFICVEGGSITVESVEPMHSEGEIE